MIHGTPILVAAAGVVGAAAVSVLNYVLDRLKTVLGDRSAVQVAEISDSAQIRAELRAEVASLRESIDKLQEDLDRSHRDYRALLQQHGELEIEHRQLKREHELLESKYDLVKRELDDLRELRLSN